MTRLLPLVLSGSTFPAPELYAARLDGEVFALDECFWPVDVIAASDHRGMSLAARIPPRLIGEQRTAAWVLGALLDAPARHQVCADSAARYRLLGSPRLSVRQVVIDNSDTTTRGGLRVTTPLRTAIDIARFQVVFDAADAELLGTLALVGGFSLADALGNLDRRRHLPGKVRASARLIRALARPPVSPR